MADFVDDLFDEAVGEPTLRPERLKALNLAKARGRTIDRLAKIPLPADKAKAALALLDCIGIDRVADRLRTVFADRSTPLVNRAVAVTALFQYDLDPGVGPDRLPDVVEGVLLGRALSDDALDLNDMISALLQTDLADAVIARIEAWRLRLAVPPSRVYARALGQPACARAHAAILAAIDHAPETVQMVRGAEVDPALFTAYITRPDERVPATGRVYHLGNCSGCGGAVVNIRLDLGESTTLLGAHLSPTGLSDAVVTAMAGPQLVAELEHEFGREPEIPLGRVAAAARRLHGHSPADERALWLLRQLEAADEGIEEWLIEPDDGMDDDVEDDDPSGDYFEDGDAAAALAELEDSGDEVAIEAAVDTIVHGLYRGRYRVDVDDPWRRLLDAFLTRVDRDVRWGEPAPFALFAWVDISIAIGELDIDSAILSEERLDQIDWRSLLAELVAADDLDVGVDDFAAGAKDLVDCLRRTRHTPTDVAAHLHAPPEVAGAVAARLGLAVDQPIFEAFE